MMGMGREVSRILGRERVILAIRIFGMGMISLAWCWSVVLLAN